ncbi:flavin reductase family protein [Actinoplanes sp. NPDC051859]|uniref:flavin reductase family protein n=1 Tax=Actinoplanes sp. NPDC051859 TaxID=3363909 RepID=UPI0037B199DB
MTAAATSGIDQADFRAVLGGFCSGVTAVTTIGPDGPAGMTCQAFLSLSLDPPLVAFAPSLRSGTYARIRASGVFCVNILAADQQWLSDRFARAGADKFREVSWRPGVTGSPVLDGVVASVDCRLEADHPAGDHRLMVGRVAALHRAQDRQPLLFLDGRYTLPVRTGQLSDSTLQAS